MPMSSGVANRYEGTLVPIFDPVPESQATDSVTETYAAIQDKCGGVVPELYKQLANSPAYLVASLTDHMGRVNGPGGKVDEATKEMIAFVVSAINGCRLLHQRPQDCSRTATTTKPSPRCSPSPACGRRSIGSPSEPDCTGRSDAEWVRSLVAV